MSGWNITRRFFVPQSWQQKLHRIKPSERRRAQSTKRPQLELLEDRTVFDVNASLSITGNLSTNIALFNAPGTGQEHTQKLTFVLINTGDEDAKFQIDVQGKGDNAGSVDLSQPGVSPTKKFTTELIPHGGTCKLITLTPTRDSAQPYDVILKVVKATLKDGNVVDIASKNIQDKMTVVQVLFPTKIYNPDTPDTMLKQGAYRIPPGTVNPTPFKITIKPDLRTANPAQYVSFRNDGDANAGRVAFDGAASQRYTSSTDIELTGTSSTAPVAAASFPAKDPVSSVREGPLKIQLLVGKTPTIETKGFSVAAIPDRITIGTVTPDAANFGVGFSVQMIVHSDSGNNADLDQIGVSELVADLIKTGGYHYTLSLNSNNTYAGPASTHVFNDRHDTTFTLLKNAPVQLLAGNVGSSVTNQVYLFKDARTGVVGIPIARSGYQITKEYILSGSTVTAFHTKNGASVTVEGKTALPGLGSAILPQIDVPVPSTLGGMPTPPATAGVTPITFNPSPTGPTVAVTLGQPPSLLGPSLFTSLQFAFIGFDRTNEPFDVIVNATSFGSVDTTFNGAVTLALDNPGSSTLNGTLTVNAVNGVATFKDLTVSNPSSSYNLSFKASATNYSDLISTTYQVNNDQIVERPEILTRPPFNVDAGEPFGYSVQIVKAAGNVDTSFNGLVSVQLSPFVINQLAGVTTVHAVAGVATFTDLRLLDPGSIYYQISIVGQNIGYIDGAAGTTISAAATKLVVTAAPPASVTRTGTFALEISAENAYGVLDKNFTGDVTLTLAGGPGGATLGGTTTVPVVNGVATFTDLSLAQLGDGYTLVAAATGLTSTSTPAISVKQSGIGTRLVFTTPPASSIASGAAFGVTFSVADDFGAVDANYAGMVTLSLNNFATTDPTALAGTLSAPVVNGKATFSGLTLRDGGSYSLSASSANLSAATSDLFLITQAPADHLILTPSGRFLTDGTLANAFEIQVVAANSLGEIDTNFSGVLIVSLLQGPGGSQMHFEPATFKDGIAQVQVEVNTPGTGYVFQVSAGALLATSPAISITNDELLVAMQPATQVSAGTGFGLVVKVRTVTGDVDTSFQGLVTVSDRAGAALGGTTSVQAVNGVATFTDIRSLQANAVTVLLVTSPGISPTSTNGFRVVPASASALVLASQPPATLTAGAAFDLQVLAKDAHGNVDNLFNTPVTITLTNNSTGAKLQGVTKITSVDGLVTFSGLKIDKAGAGYTLTIASAGLTSAISTSFTVKAAGVATQLVMTTLPPASLTAGTAFNLVVKAEDGLGTVDTSFNGTIKLTDGNGKTLASVAAVNGVANFANVHLNQAGGTFVLATSTGLTSAQSSAIDVTPGAATKLFAFSPTTSVATGAPFSVQVLALDTLGNIASSYLGMVTLALGNAAGAVLGGAVNVAAVNGQASFDMLTIDKIGTGYTLQATAGGLTASTTNPFAALADPLVLTSTLPTPVLPGAGFDVTVAAQNGNGTTDVAFTGQVTLHLLKAADTECT
ncbi:hypothetical protein BH10PLA2_BH10PLA2_14420 [soil metagenome]